MHHSVWTKHTLNLQLTEGFLLVLGFHVMVKDTDWKELLQERSFRFKQCWREFHREPAGPRARASPLLRVYPDIAQCSGFFFCFGEHPLFDLIFRWCEKDCCSIILHNDCCF